MSRNGAREFCKTIHYYETRVNDKKHKVPVKMRTSDGEKIEFFTEHFKQEDGRRFVKNSFDKLADLYDWIDDQVAELPDIEWSRKIYIKVEGSARGDLEGHTNYSGESLMSCEVKIYATAFEFGTTEEGQRYRRTAGIPKSLEKFNKNIGYGLEKESWYWQSQKEKDAEPSDPYSRALIDDTPENREMLVAFAVQFDRLRDQFFQAMSPDHVTRFLAQSAGKLALKGMEDQDAEKRMDPGAGA